MNYLIISVQATYVLPTIWHSHREKNIKVHIKPKFWIWLNSSFTIPYFPDIFVVSVYKLMTAYHEMRHKQGKKFSQDTLKSRKEKERRKWNLEES